MKSHNLIQMMSEMREYSKQLQFERDDFSQKLVDARGDIKVSIVLLLLLCFNSCNSVDQC